MPTILRIGNLRFHFYSDEFNEPPYIHVANPDGECKFWLDPVVLAKSRGVKPQDVRRIERLIYENQGLLIEAFRRIHSNG